MLKKIILPIISGVLVYNSIKLIRFFFQLPPEEFNLVSIIILAIVLNLMITGIFAFVGFAYPTSRILPDSYYRIKHPKRLKTIYQLMGVRFFKIFLLLTFYRKDDNKKYFNGTKAGIQQFSYNTRQSEFGHLMAFVAIAAVTLMLLYLGHTRAFAYTFGINIFFNLYPVILQRNHRIKIDKLLYKMN